MTLLEQVASDQKHSLPSKHGLAHMTHLVSVASSNNCIDNGFVDNLDAMKICS